METTVYKGITFTTDPARIAALEERIRAEYAVAAEAQRKKYESRLRSQIARRRKKEAEAAARREIEECQHQIEYWEKRALRTLLPFLRELAYGKA